MSYILTLVGSKSESPVTSSHADEVVKILKQADIHQSCAPIWLEADKAVDLGITEKPSMKTLEKIWEDMRDPEIDVFVTNVDKRIKKILIADMDSTIVTGETLDEVAAQAGLRDEVSKITTKAMNGEIDFHTAIRQRVALLKDKPVELLQQTLERVELSKGAKKMVGVMRNAGCKCILVSGGFTHFTRVVARQVGFHAHHANTLLVDEKRILGNVKEPILDKYAKEEYLREYAKSQNIPIAQTMAIGDGANDLLMLQKAGLGVGYKAKPIVRKALENNIIYGDLTAALYAQGFTARHIEEYEKTEAIPS